MLIRKFVVGTPRELSFKSWIGCAMAVSIIAVSGFMNITKYIIDQEIALRDKKTELGLITTKSLTIKEDNKVDDTHINNIKTVYDSLKEDVFIDDRYSFAQIPVNLNKFHIENLDYFNSAWLIAKQIPMPVEDIELILKECNEKNINPAIVFALIRKESSFNTNAKNPKSSARGYGQIIKSTGRFAYSRAFGKTDYNHLVHAHDPQYSIPMMFAYLDYLNSNYSGIRQSLEMYYGHKNKKMRQNYAESIIRQAYLYCRDLLLVVDGQQDNFVLYAKNLNINY